ncbi:MAG: hypothetical protein Q8R82_06460 [Hyphomonadaceae bacterium]|nr:hypothetical protein [Hyphomonadaceae bacterium]
MGNRIVSHTEFVAATLMAATFAAPAYAQTPQAAPAYSAPRTSFGQPSLEGVWTHNFILLMESSPHAPALTLPEAEAGVMAATMGKAIGDQLDRGLDPEVPELMRNTDGLGIVRGERRTRSVVEPADGKLPYTPDVRKEAMRGPQAKYADNHEERPNWERCITSLGLPPVTGIGTTSVNPRHIVQTPGYIVLHTEYGDEARIIPLSGTHKPKALHSPLGDSIARWDGDTLVVETIGLPANDRVRYFSNLIVPAEAVVIERFTRLSDNELLYQYTVEGTNAYTQPWLAEYSLYRTNQRMFEHACHEGNYSLPNILQAERVKDMRPAANPQP